MVVDEKYLMDEPPYRLIKLERTLEKIKKELDGQPLIRLMDNNYYKVLSERLCKEIEELKI